MDVDNGLAASEIAVMSASHDGTVAHLATVRSRMRKLQVAEGDLSCGPHEPYHRQSGKAIAAAAERPDRVRNNCSGKHTAMLWLARQLGVEVGDYLEPDSASQLEIRAMVGRFLGLDPNGLQVAIDGCGAPTFRVPLRRLAHGFANFVNPSQMPAVVGDACRPLHHAIVSEPVMFESEGEFCAELVRAMPPGSILPKNGAEGLFVIGLRRDDGPAIGIAIKVGDGARRGYLPVFVDLLAVLGAFGGSGQSTSDRIPGSLRRFADSPVRNTQNRIVGRVRSSVRWPDAITRLAR